MNKQRIVLFGELLTRLSAPDKELLLQSPMLAAHVGGAEANVAVSLSRLGHDAAFVTVLPDNPLAHACLEELHCHRVNVEHVHFAAGRMGLYFLTHGAGHRPGEVLYDRSHSSFAVTDPNTYDWSGILNNAQWLHLSGITPAVSAVAAEAARHAMIAARKNNLKISFDCNFRARLWAERAPEAPPLLRELCSFANLLFADARDIAFIYGPQSDESHAVKTAFAACNNLELIATTQRDRVTSNAQTLRGVLRSRNSTHTSKQYELGHIVDRIGSGDAFAAGIIDQLLLNSDLQTAVEFATASAVLKHSIHGDFNLSSREDINTLVLGDSPDVRR